MGHLWSQASLGCCYFDFGLPMEDGSIPSCLIVRMNAIGPKFNVKQVDGPSPL